MSVQSVNGIHVCKKSSVGARLAHLPAGHSGRRSTGRAGTRARKYAPTSRFHSHARVAAAVGGERAAPACLPAGSDTKPLRTKYGTHMKPHLIALCISSRGCTPATRWYAEMCSAARNRSRAPSAGQQRRRQRGGAAAAAALGRRRRGAYDERAPPRGRRPRCWATPWNRRRRARRQAPSRGRAPRRACARRGRTRSTGGGAAPAARAPPCVRPSHVRAPAGGAGGGERAQRRRGYPGRHGTHLDLRGRRRERLGVVAAAREGVAEGTCRLDVTVAEVVANPREAVVVAHAAALGAGQPAAACRLEADRRLGAEPHAARAHLVVAVAVDRYPRGSLPALAVRRRDRENHALHRSGCARRGLRGSWYQTCAV